MSALEVVALRVHALHPAQWKRLDCSMEVSLWNPSQSPEDSSSHIPEISESVTTHFRLESRKDKKIAHSQVRGVGGVWHHVKFALSNESKCEGGGVTRCIVMMKFDSAVPFCIHGPKLWSLPSDVFFKTPEYHAVVVIVDVGSRISKLRQNNPLLVDKHCEHSFLGGALAQSLDGSSSLVTFPHPFTGLLLGLYLENTYPGFVTGHNEGQEVVVLSQAVQVELTHPHPETFLLIRKQLQYELGSNLGEIQILLQDGVDTAFAHPNLC